MVKDTSTSPVFFSVGRAKYWAMASCSIFRMLMANRLDSLMNG